MQAAVRRISNFSKIPVHHNVKSTLVVQTVCAVTTICVVLLYSVRLFAVTPVSFPPAQVGSPPMCEDSLIENVLGSATSTATHTFSFVPDLLPCLLALDCRQLCRVEIT